MKQEVTKPVRSIKLHEMEILKYELGYIPTLALTTVPSPIK